MRQSSATASEISHGASKLAAALAGLAARGAAEPPLDYANPMEAVLDYMRVKRKLERVPASPAARVEQQLPGGTPGAALATARQSEAAAQGGGLFAPRAVTRSAPEPQRLEFELVPGEPPAAVDVLPGMTMAQAQQLAAEKAGLVYMYPPRRALKDVYPLWVNLTPSQPHAEYSDSDSGSTSADEVSSCAATRCHCSCGHVQQCARCSARC